MQISPAHWHMLVNHFPIILIIVGSLFLTVGLIFKKDAIKSTALLIVVLAGLTALPANATGEGAEEQVEEIQGVSHDAIEIHEHAAKNGLITIIGAGFIALVSVFVFAKNKKTGNTFVIITLVAALVSSGFMSYVGLTGGEIRHSEIRGDFGRGNTSSQPATIFDQDEEEHRE